MSAATGQAMWDALDEANRVVQPCRDCGSPKVVVRYEPGCTYIRCNGECKTTYLKEFKLWEADTNPKKGEFTPTVHPNKVVMPEWAVPEILEEWND